MSNLPELYRKRFIPQEIIHLKDDIILLNTDSLIITKWTSLKPRSDLSHGVSAYFMDNGFKVSKFFNNYNEFTYWYCDIIHVVKNPDNNSIIFEDLLVDVIIDRKNFVKVVDLDEIAIAHSSGLITEELMYKSLYITNNLLNIIYNGEFNKYQSVLDENLKVL